MKCEDGVMDCKDCKQKWLNEEQEVETYIVHRTLRKKNCEVYICNAEDAEFNTKVWDYGYGDRMIACELCTTYKKANAKRYTKEEAIKVRDELNKERVGREYLWVISKVDEVV